jgi:hypothetical protein
MRFTVMILLLMLVTAQSIYTDHNNDQTVRVWQGDELVVKLLVPATTIGVSGIWTPTYFDPAILFQEERTFEKGTGSPTTVYQVLKWRVIGTGATELRLRYTGSGTYDPPRHLYCLHIIAR